MSESRPVDKALEWIVYAPVGATVVLRDVAPGFVTMFATRGRKEIEKGRTFAEEKITHYHRLGQLAVAFGPGVLKRRVELQVGQARATADQTLNRLRRREDDPAPAPSPAPSRASAGPAAPGKSRPTPTKPAADEAGSARRDGGDLAIPDYDGLSASQVVDRLAGLTVAQLSAIGEYEAAHRGRRTILGKIEQLSS